MFAVLLIIFVAAVAADAFLSAAIIYHLWKYTLPGWNAVKIIVPTYLALTLLFFGLALYSLLQIQ